ncbi:MAG TPA: pirin family protein [Bryobacteraceae bacterium]|nr:pirin family protein [Bryobacteraceae bacterium]
MIQIIPSAGRFHNDFGWLSTHWHFSFDSYYDPDNVQWGPLRVFNDDVVQAGKGFPTHAHRDMEIVTVVLEGALEHADSIGTREVLRAGEVQVMSAGSGIRHSEYNASQSDPVHFLQLWVMPRTRGLTPRWEQRAFPGRQGKLLPVVSSGNLPDTLTIDQDASIYLSSLGAGEEVTHPSEAARKGYLFVTKGKVELNGTTVSEGDQARTEGEATLNIKASGDAEFILLDLPGE